MKLKVILKECFPGGVRKLPWPFAPVSLLVVSIVIFVLAGTESVHMEYELLDVLVGDATFQEYAFNKAVALKVLGAALLIAAAVVFLACAYAKYPADTSEQ